MLVKLLRHFKSFIIMLMILSVMLWFYAFKTFPKEASPAINVPFFTISIIYPGADPSTVEKQVIEKLENNLTSVTQVKEVKSISAYNVWVVSVEFDRNKNISEAYSDLNSAIDKTRADFPDAVKDPILKRVDVTDAPIYTFSVVWPYLPSVLYDKIRTLKDDLEATPWVSEVDVVWSYVPWVKIKFDYNKLLKNKINFSYAISQVQTYLDKFPADKKEVDNTLYTFTLRSYPSQFNNIVSYLSNLTLINKNWNTLKLSEVAKVTTGPFMYKKETYLMDKWKSFSSVTYSVKKVPWADILNTIDKIKNVVKTYWLTYSSSNYIPKQNFIEKLFSSKEKIKIENKDLGNLKVYEISSQKEKIDSTYKTFIWNFWQTTVIIFLVILIFIWFRESIWITLVFPLVYLIAFIVLKNIGYTFNNIVSFSLVLTLWIMVDNLIVVIEWFEEWMKKGLKKWDAIWFSIKNYWKPILSWNFTTIWMFLPIGFMLSGKIWDFMKYMPITIDVVLVISIFVALIFLPIVLSMLTFNIKKWWKDDVEIENKLFNRFEWFFRKIIDNYKKSILAFIILFFITIWFASNSLKADFLPPVDTNNIYVNLKFSPDTTLKENKNITAKIANIIDKYFEQKNKHWLLAYQSINIWNYKSLDPLDNVVYSNWFNPDLSYINLKLTDKDFQRNYNSYLIKEEISKILNKNKISSKITSLEVFIQKSWPSWGKDVSFYLVWKDIKTLVAFYNKLEPYLIKIKGTFDWSNSLEYTNWKIDITWDVDKLKQFNITSKELDLLIASIESSSNYEPNWVLLKKLDDYSSDLVDVKAYTQIDWNNILDIMVPWRDIYIKDLIKSMKINWEIKNISHTNWKLVLNIWAFKTKQTSLWSITPEIETDISRIAKIIPWVHLEYAWDVKDMKNSMTDLLKSFAVWIVLMFSVLVLHFGNFKQPFLVLSVIPFLFIWAIFALTLLWLPFSFPAQLWMFGLMWVGVNDAILLIERYNNERDSWKKYANNDELIFDVIKARFKPVLLTTLTTVLGLLTLAVKDALWGSLAVAFIWGLLLWTFIILIYIPSMLKWGLVIYDKKKVSK